MTKKIQTRPSVTGNRVACAPSSHDSGASPQADPRQMEPLDDRVSSSTIEVGDIEELGLRNPRAALPCAARPARSSAYRTALVECGQTLDKRGVPPVHVLMALSLYYESCCEHLVSLKIRDPEIDRWRWLALIQRPSPALLSSAIPGSMPPTGCGWSKPSAEGFRRICTTRSVTTSLCSSCISS